MSIATVHSRNALTFMCGGYRWQFKAKEVITTSEDFTFHQIRTGIEHVVTKQFIWRNSVVETELFSYENDVLSVGCDVVKLIFDGEPAILEEDKRTANPYRDVIYKTAGSRNEILLPYIRK